VLKSYAERKETAAPHGRAGIGILLFQDVSIVLMMLLVPILGGKDAATFSSIIKTLGLSLGALMFIVLAAGFLIPKILKLVGKLNSPEVFILTVVLLFPGMSFATSQFGLSLALGAFIAGMVFDSRFKFRCCPSSQRKRRKD
jgi:CPA2 family monovalent cation:H+ antiporter-2